VATDSEYIKVSTESRFDSRTVIVYVDFLTKKYRNYD
jgi:hypothetical protein